jgi:hypothetical protein
MHHRVERLLLSGQDTVPGTTRAGPRPRLPTRPPGQGPLPGGGPVRNGTGRGQSALHGLAAFGARHLVRGARRRPGRPARTAPRGTHGYSDPES